MLYLQVYPAKFPNLCGNIQNLNPQKIIAISCYIVYSVYHKSRNKLIILTNH